jgi:predicted amidophosphoribosyltransferase
MFCAKCGAKVERDIRCPRCSNSVQVDDAYCRKCGLPLRSD